MYCSHYPKNLYSVWKNLGHNKYWWQVLNMFYQSIIIFFLVHSATAVYICWALLCFKLDDLKWNGFFGFLTHIAHIIIICGLRKGKQIGYLSVFLYMILDKLHLSWISSTFIKTFEGRVTQLSQPWWIKIRGQVILISPINTNSFSFQSKLCCC